MYVFFVQIPFKIFFPAAEYNKDRNLSIFQQLFLALVTDRVYIYLKRYLQNLNLVIDYIMKKKTIGQALREIREERELYQYDIAERLNIAQKNVYNMENRKDLRLSTLKRYVEALGGQLNIWVEFEDESKAYKISKYLNEEAAV